MKGTETDVQIFSIIFVVSDIINVSVEKMHLEHTDFKVMHLGILKCSLKFDTSPSCLLNPYSSVDVIGKTEMILKVSCLYERLVENTRS